MTILADQVPKNVNDYCKKLSEDRSWSIDTERRLYTVAQEKLKKAILESNTWHLIKIKLSDWGGLYYVKTGLTLFAEQNINDIEIKNKPFESFLEKAFRHQYINEKYDDKTKRDTPKTPFECLDKIDDVVRCLVVVKYLDGVNFFIKQVLGVCESENIKTKIEYKCSDEGYFATHLYLQFEIETPVSQNEIKKILSPLEIQITTQLQEVLRTFLHMEYKKKRVEAKSEKSAPCQWRYDEQEFSSNFLGHLIRHIEGQIMEVRKRKDIADASHS